MPLIVVGGHSRNVGKTSVTTGLIHAFKEYEWTAVKISSHQHQNIPLQHGKKSHAFNLFQETNRDGSSDTSRFLVAGASRSFWIQIHGDFLEEAARQLLPILHSSPFVIVESNRILRLLQPDLCIMVLRYDIEEFKESAREALRQANAVVVVNRDSSPPPWERISGILSGIPQFITADPQIIPVELINFVRPRLDQGRKQ